MGREPGDPGGSIRDDATAAAGVPDDWVLLHELARRDRERWELLEEGGDGAPFTLFSASFRRTLRAVEPSTWLW